MSKKSVIARNNKREQMIIKFAERRKQLKAEGNWEALDKLPRNASPIRYKNRCKLTGRPRGYVGDLGISRIKLRDLALYGKIPGMTKASW
ncbi:MAG TPA: 30S ribosomal protein S14 [Chitinophagales bacterium]|nr:30S ribosomal protein S14 [Chitinophagales bacterium]HMX03946.1 30S ribosomal protein S14 [Chitinophagales bacterium]HMZ88228.1 30S ribosomal protein S14 [Chitinophagales bacterium]HNE45543.1 30S ribosomal protein S14 [Chitinophagales bacterium]HNF67741.1 30S ribosomal protein S14 [Chitinophagales bacterium]